MYFCSKPKHSIILINAEKSVKSIYFWFSEVIRKLKTGRNFYVIAKVKWYKLFSVFHSKRKIQTITLEFFPRHHSQCCKAIERHEVIRIAGNNQLSLVAVDLTG